MACLVIFCSRLHPDVFYADRDRFLDDLNGNITVEVVKIQGNRISLGIVAPSNVKILRGELIEQQAQSQLVELVIEDGLLVA